MKSEHQICRLCLNTCNIFATITETIKESLKKLQLEIDLSKTNCPVMCGKCSETIQKCLDFKYICIKTQGYVDGAPRLDNTSSNKKENCNKSENHGTNCCLCMKIVTSADNFVSLNIEEKIVTSVEIVLLKHFSDINISQINNRVICALCLENLEFYSTFITTCLEGEEKIKKYCEDNRIDSTKYIDLYCVLENKNFVWLNEVKAEKLYPTSKCDDALTNTNITLESEGEKNIKREYIPKLELDALEIDIKHEDPSEQSSQDNALSTQSYKCTLCDFHTEQSFRLKKHMRSHKSADIHKCQYCDYQTTFLRYLRTHMITHKSSSEVSMHRCAECGFASKRKNALTRHMLTHKSGSEVTMHKCTACGFETKHKNSLKSHTLLHDKADETAIFKCRLCDYQTKIKRYLQKHMVNHKNLSEIVMHKCKICNYQTKYIQHVGQHMLTHKSCSEVTMYKCHLCTHQTKMKGSLRRHMMIHKSGFEVAVHKCLVCEYQTRHAGELSKHMVCHKDSPGVIIYNCAKCSFETTRKNGLRQHMIVHRRRFDVPVAAVPNRN